MESGKGGRGVRVSVMLVLVADVELSFLLEGVGDESILSRGSGD